MTEHRPTPRSLDEAFGPGPHHFIDPGPPLHACDRIVIAGCAAALLVWWLIEVFL